jgi:hypothetical protein
MQQEKEYTRDDLSPELNAHIKFAEAVALARHLISTGTWADSPELPKQLEYVESWLEILHAQVSKEIMESDEAPIVQALMKQAAEKKGEKENG